MENAPLSNSAAPGPAAEASPRTQNPGGVKETIESILVAFILAFIFRAFVVEAFVIPTGSMAPTLMGAHTRFNCPDCAYRFDVNYTAPNRAGSGESGSDDMVIPSRAGRLATPIYCPNCGFSMDRSQVDDPPVFYGDRILVLKYLYLFTQPDRWDVVVFKSPVEPRVYNYEQNYIKRLVGRPGEGVMVLDGDVYIRAPGAKDPRDFLVQPKPRHVQDALWRVVYDNDHRPQGQLDRGGMRPWQLPWTVADGSGWDLDSVTHGRIFAFENKEGASSISFDPAANATAHTLSDYLIYDVLPLSGSTILQQPSDVYPNAQETPVSDLDLRLTYQRTAGDGPLTLSMSKRDHVFSAVITPTTAALFHDVGTHRKQIGQTLSFARSDRPVRVELANADYRTTLRVDDRVVAQSTPADYAPDLARLLGEFNARQRPPAPRVRIEAGHQSCRLSHLSLWRDVHYYNTQPGSRSPLNTATPEEFPNRTQQLGPDEYFVMGDNSLVSFDARFWQEPVELPGENLYAKEGRIPGRFMLGKAFFVYWPAGYKPAANLPGFVPNFGDMRVIH